MGAVGFCESWPMSEPQNPEVQPDELDDTKEAMRRALEAKKAAQHRSGDGMATKKSIGGPQGKIGGSRQFRRKSGG